MQPTVDLLKQADIAMYQVKSRGATPVLLIPQMQIAINRVQLGTTQMAITGNGFELHHQPQQRLDGRIVGVEGLIRWRHPGGAGGARGHSISVAEKAEPCRIGHWVRLRTARATGGMGCDPLPACRCQSTSVRGSSSMTLWVWWKLLRETGAPHLLKLELTESPGAGRCGRHHCQMIQLKTKGVRFSVDDFGTGCGYPRHTHAPAAPTS